MFPNLFLVDETFIISENIFDRILDHDDMPMRIFIEIVDHRDDTRRLSTSSPTSDEDESFVLIEEFEDIFLESYGFGRWEIFFDRSHSDSDAIGILRDIGTKSSSFVLVDEIDTLFFRINDLLSDRIIHIVDDHENIFV